MSDQLDPTTADPKEDKKKKKKGEGDKRIGAATKLIKLVVASEDVELFPSEEGRIYVTVPIGKGVKETFSITDKTFKEWLSRVFFAYFKMGISGSAIQDTVSTLSGIARTADPRRVYTRVAAIDKEVYLDLGRNDRKVLKINPEGWWITPPPKNIHFIRRVGMLGLPDPVKGRSIVDLIPQVVNVQPNSEDLKMVIGWMLGCLRGIKPFPILIVAGEQGSGKSYACRVIRECLDPSQANLSLTPANPRDMLITTHNSYILGFDNLSFVPDWLSDVLCSIATGAGFRTRELTTDAQEMIFSAARPIVMNSIADIVRRGDLLDRALLVNTTAIDDRKRATEEEMEHKFQSLRPEILGSLATAVSQALANKVELERKPRMADFAVTVESAASSFGWQSGEFLEVYEKIRKESSEILLDGDLIASALQKCYYEDQGTTWVGTADSLRERIAGLTPPGRQAELPKSVKGFINQIRRLAPSLRAVGIQIELPKQVKVKGKVVRLMKVVYLGSTDKLPFEESEPKPTKEDDEEGM